MWRPEFNTTVGLVADGCGAGPGKIWMKNSKKGPKLWAENFKTELIAEGRKASKFAIQGVLERNVFPLLVQTTMCVAQIYAILSGFLMKEIWFYKQIFNP